VTLNITLVTSGRIYQSTDFMLTIGRPYEVVSLSSTKIVRFQYEDTDGFVVYTGVGRWPDRNSKDTSVRVADWLKGHAGLSFDGVVERVRAGGDGFLGEVASFLGIQCHKFTVAGFENGVPVVALVSNIEEVSGRTFAAPLKQLRVTKKAYRGSSFAVVTGQRNSVPRNRRQQLERLGNRPNVSPNLVRDTLARVNAIAAESLEPKRTVSEACSVFSIDAAGDGVHELTSGQKIDSINVIYGNILPGVAEVLGVIGLDPRSTLLKGAYFATDKPAVAESVVCERSRTGGYDGYVLHDVSVPRMDETRPLAVGRWDDTRVVGGFCSTRQDPGRYHYWIWTDADGHGFLSLETQSEIGMGFMSDGSVVVAATIDESWEVVRKSEDEIVKFDKAGRVDAGCGAVNNLDMVGGWVGGVDGKDHDPRSRRPIVWDREGKVLDILDVDRLCGAEWGRVAGLVGNRALVIGHVNLDMRFMLWEIGGGVTDIGQAGSRIIATGLNDRLTVGVQVDSNARIAVAYDGLRWTRLSPEVEWDPASINSLGAVSGSVRRGGFLTPAIWSDGHVLELTTYRSHHVHADKITDAGEVFGHGGADQCIHGLLWLPASDLGSVRQESAAADIPRPAPDTDNA
jgi:hypothetical protein